MLNKLGFTFSKKTRNHLRFLWSFTHSYKTKIFIAIFAMVITALTEPAIAYLFKLMIDDASIRKDEAMIILIPIVLIVIFLIRSIASLISVYLSNWVANTVIRDLRSLIFNHFLKLKQSYLDKKTSSKMLSKITYDVEQVSGSVVDAWIILIKDSLSIISLLSLLLYLNFFITLIIFIGAPVIAYVFKYLSKRIKNISLVIQEIMANLTQITEQSLSLLKLIKIFGVQNKTKQAFGDVINNLRTQKMKIIVASELNVVLIQMVVICTISMMVYLALKSNVSPNSNAMSTGDLVAYITTVSIIFSPFKRLSGVNAILQRAFAALDSIQSVLNTPKETETGDKVFKQTDEFNGKIEFKNLSFGYDDEKEQLFSNLNLTIPAGKIIALVGSSGSGKSTLAQLLIRFYDCNEGAIYIDGVDIREYKLQELRNKFSYVEQTVLLFNDTIAENIKMGEQVDENTVIEALKNADLYDFVQSLPNGLNTKVGDRGFNLSGGQRQRIAIARALIKPSSVLILDEATSSLDNQTEATIQKTIFEKRKGKTTLIIAHRLSTIKNADCIFILNKGKICETGKHDELLAKNGIYANLYQNESSNPNSNH